MKKHLSKILQQQEISKLSDAQLLAILLGKSHQGHHVVNLAQKLLDRYGNLYRLINIEPADLCQQGLGVGPLKYTQLQVCIELSQRITREKFTAEAHLTDPQETQFFLQTQMANRDEESFACIFLTSKHQVLHFETLFYGSINTVSVHPRVLVKKALQYNAAAMIIAHNHPSGDTTPSQADLGLTERLKMALELIDVKLVDHIIVSHTESYSFAEAGLMI